MSKYQISKDVGQFEIKNSRAGTPLIMNNKKGKNKVMIPCRDMDHAKDILEKLKQLKGGGEIWI